ncbi:fructoselysine and glucoselysine-specific PTS system IIA component [Breznakia blatticola]|uniref:Fructoselysine and glucoselysine-specific PTS system IIA component n=1 Tax=Breznakia blatticola TaxID=1754012 RepID=A0A4R8ABC4_9FIRM|nr:PTS fructose transporter subunit IIA [Breznakia blatticola]TDW25747.1 fructoselysine and glucoselysine-specific PTS system IIA component [Breznakia blatticola]
MRKIVVATHASFAKGIKESVEFIIGKQEMLQDMCAYVTQDFDIEKEISSILDELGDDDTLVVLVDLFGGSVSNAFAARIQDERVHVVTGVNFPLLLDLLLNQDDDVESVIQRAVQSGKDGILYVNQVLNEQMEEEDELDD